MKISVVIPSFEPGRYLNEAVKSVTNQSGKFEVIEIIIIDDQSKDVETLSVYEELSENPLVKLLKNHGNRGSAVARNIGLHCAKCEWVIFLDADDILLPGSIQSRVSLLRENPKILWCGGDFVQFDDQSGVFGDPYFESRLDKYDFLVPAFNSENKMLVWENPIQSFLKMTPANTSVIMAARSILLQAGGFDEDLKMQQDLHLFLRLALRYDYGFIAKPLMANRQHLKNTTASQVATNFWAIKALNKIKKLPEFSLYQKMLNAKIANNYISNAYILQQSSKYKEALVSSLGAVECRPLYIKSWEILLSSILRLVFPFS